MTTKQYLALCLVVFLLLIPVVKLDCLVSKIEYLCDTSQTRESCPTLVILIDSQSAQTESTEPTEPTEETQPDPTEPKPQTKSPVQPQNGGSTHKNYYGRLFIPDADIDVALYYGTQQSITNRQDSANIFSMSVFDGLYIADHNTQEFKKLSNVEVGMLGYIQFTDGSIVHIKCTEILSGRNTGKAIEDENGNTNLDADYLMYTCVKGQRNILICLWKHN